MSVAHPVDSTCVGIDFGTTNSSVCLFDGVQFDFVPFVSNTGAKSYMLQFRSMLDQDILSLKSLISRPALNKFDDNIVHLCSDFFVHLRHETNKYFKRNIRNCVITVPARFDDIQRQYVVESATKGGWNVIRLLAEPTAAFLAYDHLHELPDNLAYAIYDLGGGTFDFSIVRKNGILVQVLGTIGDLTIGGDHFDQVLAGKMHVDPALVKNMRENSQIDDFSACSDMVNTTIRLAQELIKETTSVENIIIVGGGALMPFVVEAVKNLGAICVAENPQLVVAGGAAIHAYRLGRENYLLIDVLPLSIGVEIAHGMVEYILPKNSPLPAMRSVIFTNTHAKQTHIIFHIVQGESILSSECRSLGRVEIEIVPGPPRTVQVEVECLIDTNGLLQVSCQGGKSGTKVELSVTSGLTQGIVERLIDAGQTNIIEKEVKRKFLQICDRIDTVLNVLNNSDEEVQIYKVKRNELTELTAAENLLYEIEQNFSVNIENAILQTIQNKYEALEKYTKN